MELGCAIAVAMEAGVIPFGDASGAVALLHEAGRGTPLGRILASGAAVTGQAFGVTRVPVAKRQALAAYDPRAIKGIGVTYATSPMGGDHTAGYTVMANIARVVPPLESKGQAELSRQAQIHAAILDSLGLCTFIAAPTEAPEVFASLAAMVSALLGRPFSSEGLHAYGKNVLATERAFNRGAGLNQHHDRLPDFFATEKLPPHNTVFDVPQDDLDRLTEG
jgi:aldehyde:ferredoxin oxidoreductase